MKMTITQYKNQIELGYIEPIKCISVFKKLAKQFNLKGGYQIITIYLKYSILLILLSCVKLS